MTVAPLLLPQPYEINLALTSVALKLVATLPGVLEPTLLHPVVEGSGAEQTTAEGGWAGGQTLHSVLVKVRTPPTPPVVLQCSLSSVSHDWQGIVAFVPSDSLGIVLTSHINIGIP